MNLFLFVVLFGLGSGVAGWACLRFEKRLPLLLLSLLLLFLSLQLLWAISSSNQFPDLAAIIAQYVLVLPALIGICSGMIVARIQGRKLLVGSTVSTAIPVALLAVGLSVAATMLIVVGL